MDLFKELMNHGYLINRMDIDTYRVSKISVLCNSSVLKNKDQSRISWEDFPAYDEALDFCKKRIGWVEELPQTIANTSVDTVWQMELMYKHRGLGLHSATLGQLKKLTHDEAKKVANERAEDYIRPFSEDVTSWEVRVRPCRER